MSDPTFFAGQTLPAGELQDLGEYGTWTPTLGAATTTPALGTGSVQEGEYHRNGRLITLFFNITFGSSGVSAGSGIYRLEGIPFPSDGLGSGTVVGGNIRAVHDTSSFIVCPRVQSTTQFTMFRIDSSATTEVTAAAPAVWDASDFFRGCIIYLGTT